MYTYVCILSTPATYGVLKIIIFYFSFISPLLIRVSSSSKERITIHIPAIPYRTVYNFVNECTALHKGK